MNGGLKCPHLLQSKQCKGLACYEGESLESDPEENFTTTTSNLMTSEVEAELETTERESFFVTLRALI